MFNSCLVENLLHRSVWRFGFKHMLQRVFGSSAAILIEEGIEGIGSLGSGEWSVGIMIFAGAGDEYNGNSSPSVMEKNNYKKKPTAPIVFHDLGLSSYPKSKLILNQNQTSTY